MTSSGTVDALKMTGPQQRSAAKSCINAWLKTVPPIERPHTLPTTVLCTSGQWQWAAVDSCVEFFWDDLNTSVDQVASVVCQPASTIGRELFRALTELMEAHDALQARLFEVGRFVPPSEHLAEGLDLVASMQQLACSIVENVIACLAEGLDGAYWEKAGELHDEYALALQRLTGLTDLDLDDPVEMRLQRSMGLSAGELPAGSGFTFPSRLRVAWTKRIDELDSRLRRQVPHLLKPGQELSFEVRHHLTALLATTHVLPAHQAAMASRDLTLAALAKDPAYCAEIIAELVNEETGHYATHRQVQREISAFKNADDPEDRMDPACNLYQRVIEGDIRRIARRVLGLLGERQERNVMLKTIEDRLSAHIADPSCLLLLSCINRQWRNAIAHSQFHWDTVNQCISLDGELTSPEELADAAIRAMETGAGFNAGVEIALNEFDRAYSQPPPVDLLTWDMQVERRMGASGIELLSVRRFRKSIQIHVRPLSIETFRDHLIAVLVARHGIPEVDTWEIKQADRPDVVLKSSALDLAETLKEIDTDSSVFVHPHAVELILYAEASLNFGQPAEQAAIAVRRLSSAIILGEFGLFERQRIIDGATYIVDGMAVTISRQIRAIEKTATLFTHPAAEHLISHSNMLQAQLQGLHVDPETTLQHTAQLAMTVLSEGTVEFPWLDL